jgi:hypothetical protein
MTTHGTLDWLPGQPQMAGSTSFYFFPGAWQYLKTIRFELGDVWGIHMPKVRLCLNCGFTD